MRQSAMMEGYTRRTKDQKTAGKTICSPDEVRSAVQNRRLWSCAFSLKELLIPCAPSENSLFRCLGKILEIKRIFNGLVDVQMPTNIQFYRISLYFPCLSGKYGRDEFAADYPHRQFPRDSGDQQPMPGAHQENMTAFYLLFGERLPMLAP